MEHAKWKIFRWIAVIGVSLACGSAGLPGEVGQAPMIYTGSLPERTNGNWHGVYAVYEHPNMDVVIETNGYAKIYLKSDGRQVGKSVNLGWQVYYTPGGSSGTVDRPVVQFAAPPPPDGNPKRVAFQVMCSEQTQVEIEYVFENNTVAMNGQMHEPISVFQPGRLEFGIGLSATHQFASDTPLAEIKERVSGYSLRLSCPDGSPVEYDYYSSVELTNQVDSATITGPWGPRRFRVEQGGRCRLGMRNYNRSPLWEGYSIHKVLGNRDQCLPIQITVE